VEKFHFKLKKNISKSKLRHKLFKKYYSNLKKYSKRIRLKPYYLQFKRNLQHKFTLNLAKKTANKKIIQMIRAYTKPNPNKPLPRNILYRSINQEPVNHKKNIKKFLSKLTNCKVNVIFINVLSFCKFYYFTQKDKVIKDQKTERYVL
jgi:hypothetical protein